MTDAGTSADKLVGITVLPEWAQVEGVGPLLDNLQHRAGAKAIATSPYVLAPADEASGVREPPADAGAGEVRLLDRDLFGKRALFCRAAPSYRANPKHYRGLRYQPAPPSDLTESDGATVGEFIAAAKRRGLEVWLQVQAAIPPGYRVQFGGPEADDVPLLPDGSMAAGRVDKNGSLASPHIKAYVAALLADLAEAYPLVDGFRVDWPEYPPYTLDSIFLDFSDHAMRAGQRLGYDTARMRADTDAVRRQLLGELTDGDLGSLRSADFTDRYPGLGDLFALKADIVVEFVRDLRSAIPAGMKLAPQAFPPPWNAVSGFDYGRVGTFSDAIGVKLYTMHWPMMLRFYADTLASANPGLDRGLLARRLVDLIGTGGPRPDAIDDLRYPEPEEQHPVGADAQSKKIAEAQQAAGACPVFPFAHAYGPIEDFAARAAVAWTAGVDGMWVNRYGYLSDAKLDRLGELRT